MNGFEIRKQKKIKDILEAAFELFNTRGVDDVHITEIAQRANVSKVSIYNFFGSKEELARQVIYAFMDKKALEFSNLMDSGCSFKEKYEKMFLGNMEAGAELHEGLLDNRLLVSPKMQQFLRAYFETKIKPRFIAFIEQGKREGDIDSEISTESVLLYIEAISGILNSPLEMKQRYEIGKLFFFGLRGK
jgi:AcrR family transcriptional regulator